MQCLRAILGWIASDRNLVPRLKRGAAPAVPGQVVWCGQLDEPLFNITAFVLHIQSYERMGLNKLEIRYRSLQYNRFRCVER